MLLLPLSRQGNRARIESMAPALPGRIGPIEFGELGGWVTVRCPKDYTPIVQRR
jgi:hypothetical protein